MNKILQFIRQKFKNLGPGFITGAADDDPSGVATYSIAGAQFGYLLNWLSLFLIPMMIAIQEMCGRIGMNSGVGLAGVIKKYYSKKLLFSVIFLLLVSNIINIGADLGIMAASLQMLFGFSFLSWLILITIISVALEILIPYKKYSMYLKWMGMTLLVYVITAFIVKQNWLEVLKATVIPHIEFNSVYLMTLVGFVGTTISPYLFFWQASEEVEEEIEEGKISDFYHKPRVYKKEVIIMQKDTEIGMVFSNIVTMCIILTTAATLHQQGITDIESPQQAALALKPFAGELAFFLFTLGIIGIGLQSIPILAGGLAYAFSEGFGEKEGLGKKFYEAKFFYIVIGLATIIGAVGNVIGINPIKALYYAAVINGVISVPLIAIIIKLAGDERVVGKFKSSPISKTISIITLIFVSLASTLMIVSLFKKL